MKHFKKYLHTKRVAPETTRDEHSLSNVPTYIENETNSSLELEERPYHVYTEIAENSTERLRVSVVYDCKSHATSNTESSTALGKDVLYMNAKCQQI